MLTNLRKRARWAWHRLYPWTGLHGLDKKLVTAMGKTSSGFFVEAGANDGVRQSNTYYLSRRRGWRGLLIEPIPSLSSECKRNRPESIVRNCALVREALNGTTIELVDVDLMSMVRDASEEQERAIQVAESVQGLRRNVVTIEGRSLSSLLEEIGSPTIDLFSLDVEGYELDVLQGLNLEKHSPRWILIETKQIESVEELISRTHKLHSQLTHHDFLFVRCD